MKFNGGIIVNKIGFLLTFLLFTASVTNLLGQEIQEIKVISSDNVEFKVDKEVLRTSKVLENMFVDYPGDTLRVVTLSKSSEDFRLILPLLESVYASSLLPEDNTNGQLSEKDPLEIARIIELANFFDVQQIIDHGSNVLKEKLDVISRESCGSLECAIQAFLGSKHPLSPEMNQLMAGKILEDHPVKTWLPNKCTSKTLRLTGINSVAFSPNGNSLATGSRDGTAKICDIDCLNKLERILSNDITLEQALILILFYGNKDNKSFKCPEYLSEDFKSFNSSTFNDNPDTASHQHQIKSKKSSFFTGFFNSMMRPFRFVGQKGINLLAKFSALRNHFPAKSLINWIGYIFGNNK